MGSRLDRVTEERLKTIEGLRERGIDPYPHTFRPSHSASAARLLCESEGERTRPVSVAGRVMAKRKMGKMAFLDLRDGSGKLQTCLRKDLLGEERYDVLKDIDIGDFVGVEGELFLTKTGEVTVEVAELTFLAKSLRPLPEKWHGLVDVETRYRQRYLDLISNDDARRTVALRRRIISATRQFLEGQGYVEVETPVLQGTAGCALARPFVTHHHALDEDLYLRIALELYHKRLLVGGVDKLFEIGKNFRNEGLSRRHNPEFTMLEAYQAFGDYETMMETVQSLICHVAQNVLGGLKVRQPRKAETCAALAKLQNELVNIGHQVFSSPESTSEMNSIVMARVSQISHCHLDVDANKLSPSEGATKALEITGAIATDLRADRESDQGAERWRQLQSEAVFCQIDSLQSGMLKLGREVIIDLTPKADGKWETRKYKDLIREKAGTDWFEISPSERRQRAHDMGAEIGKEYEDFEVTGAVFEKLIEPTLIQPTFVTHLPKELVPLAKLSPDDPTTVEVFECCINGQEISPGYTEQNDPIQQRTTLEHQAGGEQQKLDEDFLVALEHGMPPAGGIGIGIDRLCMMLLGQESIRDVILFPQLKPK